jgi:uncharacterized protein (TIGR00725 family)
VAQLYVAVIGPGDATADEMTTAEEVGGLLALEGVVVISGGLSGVMAASCKGARARAGQTVGLLPGRERSEGNQYLTVSLPTGLGELRNGLIVNSSDGIISIGGGWGTLSEIGLALRTGKPLIAIRSWQIELPQTPGQTLQTAEDAAAAVQTLLAQIRHGFQDRSTG